MRVAVVGGGMAGAAATARLTRAGVDVVLLEASGELGGRVRSAPLGASTGDGAPCAAGGAGAHGEVDLGASWLHETLVNPLFELAVRAGVAMVYDDACTAYVLPGGEHVGRAAGAEPLKREVEQAIALAYHADVPLDRQPPMVSLRDFVRDFLAGRPAALVGARQRVLAGRMMQENEHWTAQAWEHIPAAEAVHDALGRNAFVLGGMRRVWDLVWARRDPAHTAVRLNQRVTALVQTDTGVEVRAVPSGAPGAAGTGAGTSCLVVDRVVCAVPMGALKGALEPGGAGLVFSPPLPSGLAASVRTTDIAALGKAFLLFDEVWWAAEPDALTVLVDEPLDAALPPLQRPVTFINPWVHHAPERGALLLALTGPPLTQALERDPRPDAVYDLLLPSLRAIRRDAGASAPPPPRPQAVSVSQWTRDPAFGGSYSARRIGQSYEAMVQPFLDGHGRIVFAGEHTVWDGAGCVHGAYASGVRAADDLLEQAGVDLAALPPLAA